MSLAKKAYQGFKWNAFSNVLSILLIFLQVYILVRLIDKSDFGLMAILSLVIAYLFSFSDFGFENAIIYEKKITPNERSGIFSLFLYTGVVLFILCILFSFPLSQFFEKSEIRNLLWMMAIALVFNGVGRFHKILLGKELHFKSLAFIQICCVSLTFLLVVLLAKLGFGIRALIFAFIFNSFLENVLCFLVGNKFYPVRLTGVSRSLIDKFFRLGKYEIGLKFSSIFLKKMDVIVLGKNFGADVLGQFEVVKNLMNKPHTVIPTVFTEVSYPIYAKISGSIKNISKLYRNQLQLIFLLSAPVYSFLFVMSREVVEFYLGVEWISVIPILKIFSIVFLIRSSGIPLAGLLMSMGRIKFLFYWNVIASIITLFILLYMLPEQEIGIAKALLIVQLVYILPVYYLIIKKHTEIGLIEYLTIMIIPIIFSMISYYMAYLFLPLNDLILSLTLVLITGTLLYLALVITYLKIFSPEILQVIKNYRE